MIRYDGLEKALKEKNKNKTDLCKDLGFSSRTIAKISKGEKLSKKTLNKISDYLNVPIEELTKEVSDNIILQTLRDEKNIKYSKGLYHELQIMMAYNSNHIEGSRLSEDQTRMIYETNTIDADDTILIDDILEIQHHFRAFDYIIDVAEEELSEDIIKTLHYIIKHDTSDSKLDWFKVGDYKNRINVVGGRKTAKPSEVAGKMKRLLDTYNSKNNVSFEDIVELHAEFEFIHPFQDGNGRVGRLICFKECLRHNIVPFVILDEKKQFYYRGLNNWTNEKGWLIDTCLNGQDTFIELLKLFEIPFEKKETSN